MHSADALKQDSLGPRLSGHGFCTEPTGDLSDEPRMYMQAIPTEAETGDSFSELRDLDKVAELPHGGESTDPQSMLSRLSSEPPSPSISSYQHVPSTDSWRRESDGTQRLSTEGTMRSKSSMASLANLKKGQMSEQLLAAKNAAMRRRVKISGVSGIMGIFFALTATFGVLFGRSLDASRDIRALVSTVSVALILLGLFFFLLALLPTDRRAVPIASSIFATVQFIMGGVATYISVPYILGTQYPEEVRAALQGRGVAILANGLMYLVLAVYMVRQITTTRLPKRLLSRTWWSCGLFFLSVGCLTMMQAVVSGATRDMGALGWIIVTVVAFLCMVGAWNVNFRTRLQHFIGTRGESAGSAAAEAALVGARSVDEVLDMARCSFFTVNADRLKMEHIMNNKMNESSMSKLSRRTRLGEADAFISHSWSDDPLAKWNALQSWRKDFKKEHQAEPKVWIDKYCIDQEASTEDFENSLACLPIYLASCSKMVVICGETYLTRLWCIIELFVFIEMGGSPENLEVIILPDPENSIAEQIQNFEARDLKCSRNDVADFLHSVLEAGAGLDGIRQLVQKRFEEKAVKRSRSKATLLEAEHRFSI